MKRIFVQIASYRDLECRWTVGDTFAKAKHPERIFVGICNQVDLEEDKELFAQPYPFADHVRELLVPAKESRGVCWARHRAQTLYQGEEYLLVIDSHMRFIQDWDEIFIEELKRCASPKPIFSNYPAAYSAPDQVHVTDAAIVMVAKPYDRLGDLRFASRVLKKPTQKPLRGAFIAGGFFFATALVMEEVPHDPYMYFAQEEITMSARLFTHGWDVFSPCTNLMYHNYVGFGELKKRRFHWQDNGGWLKMARLGRKRCDFLLAGKTDHHNGEHLIDIEKYGLGKVRTLKEFEEFVGIHFAAKEVLQKAQEGAFIQQIEQYA